MAKIWIVPNVAGTALDASAREAITAGQRLASAAGGSAELLLLGSGLEAIAAEAGGYDLAQVWTCEHESLATYTPGAWIGALAAAVGEHAPDFLIFAHSYQTVDFAPRLAARIGAALVPEAVGFAAGDDGMVWTRPVLGGKLEARVRTRGEGPVVVSIQAGAFPSGAAATGSAPVAELAVGAEKIVADRQILRIEEAGGQQVDLTKAEVIVAVGRGIGGEDKVPLMQELAAALGAEIAASRPVIDSGWLERERQVGSSGQTVAPKLYLAVGISGAIQHMVGMKGSQTVIAINKDARAPIFAAARYGIVGDLHEIVPPLLAKIKEVNG